MAIAHIIIQFDEGEEELAVSLAYSGGNDLSSDAARQAFNQAIERVSEALTPPE